VSFTAPTILSTDANADSRKRVRYAYIATMKTQPGQRDAVVSILLEGVAGLRDAGCGSYIVSVSDKDPDMIWVTELWLSKQHHDASLQLPETKAAIRRAMPMLTGEFTGQELSVVGGLGVGPGSPPACP
jgi:quinol monooxygenase YgiN